MNKAELARANELAESIYCLEAFLKDARDQGLYYYQTQVNGVNDSGLCHCDVKDLAKTKLAALKAELEAL